MPLQATLTEELVQRLTPDKETLQRAREISEAKKLKNLAISPDGTWLLGECQGSAKTPYQISADFIDPNVPVFRSTSPSRKSPDKYSLALLLTYLNDPNSFTERDAPEDLIAKREKKQAADEKKKFGPPSARKGSKTAQDKKLAAQREGLELLERLLVELVAGGNWLEAMKLEKVDRLSKQLNDAYLPAATYTLRRLILLNKQKELSEDEKMAYAADLIAQLWAIVQKGHNYLESRLAPGETQDDADAAIEEVLGKTWQLSELREKGYCQNDLTLYELAYERMDDEARLQRLEISDLIDLSSGQIYQGISSRPFKGLNQIPEQPSYMAPIQVPEAAIYPGYINRRIRWEKGVEQLIEDGRLHHLEKVYALAQTDFKQALDAFRAQVKQALAPREAVVLLGCQRIGKVGEKVILEDKDGVRIEAVDRRKDYSNVANLTRVAGMLGKDHPAILVRLFLLPLPNTIVALPLAAITPQHHLRLGL